MTILTKGHKLWPEYFQLQKCGSVALGKHFKLIGLNCYFCSTIVTRLDEFRKHIEKHHSKELGEQFELEGEIAIKIESFINGDEIDPVNENKTEVEMDIFNQETKEDTENVTYSKIEERKERAESFSEKQTRAKIKNSTEDTSVKPINVKDSDDNDEYTPETVDDSESKSLKNINDSELESETADDFEENKSHLESKTKNKLPPKLDINSTENQDLVSYIIDFYEKHTHVWNSTQKEFKQRHKTLEDLAQQLQQTFQIPLEPSEIESIFKKLRSEYRIYSKRNHCGEEYTEPKIWYTKLWFLPTSKISKNVFISKESILKVAKLYHNHTTLWNMDDETSSNKKLRQKALERLFKELNIDCSLSELKVAITRMKNEYVAEKTKRLKCEVENKPFEPKNPALYNQLYFMDSYVGPLRCQYCNQIFRFYEKFQIHVAGHEERKPFHCKFCQKPFSTLSGLHQHTMREHNTTEKCYPCTHCDKSFHSASDLKRHKNSHIEEMKYVCELCGKFFHSKNFYTDHLTKHKKRYKCSLCPMEYSDRYRYNSHMNSHNNIRAFVCDICGKGFFSQETMAQHKLLHGNVEKHECNLCGRKFKQIAAMHSHKKWYHQTCNSHEKL